MGRSQPLSVILADDQPAFRQGLRTLLGFYQAQENFQFHIVGEAASADQAISLALEQHPTLLFLDLELPKDDGVAALQDLRQQHYTGKILVISAHQEDEWVFRAMRAGADGYVFKSQLAMNLHQAIQTVLKNEVFLPPDAATGFFRSFHFYEGRSVQSEQTLHLTAREKQVLHWLVQGASNQAIANHLHITIATVKAHLTAVFEKLEVKSRSQAIVKALKLGLVNP